MYFSNFQDNQLAMAESNTAFSLFGDKNGYITFKQFRRDKLLDESLSEYLFVRRLTLPEALSRRNFMSKLRKRNAENCNMKMR